MQRIVIKNSNWDSRTELKCVVSHFSTCRKSEETLFARRSSHFANFYLVARCTLAKNVHISAESSSVCSVNKCPPLCHQQRRTRRRITRRRMTNNYGEMKHRGKNLPYLCSPRLTIHRVRLLALHHPNREHRKAV